VRFQEIAARVTGFSTPVFGVSWSPSEPEVTAARRVVTFLEDRRVLARFKGSSQHRLPDQRVAVRRELLPASANAESCAVDC
jgi:hypothetical protein